MIIAYVGDSRRHSLQLRRIINGNVQLCRQYLWLSCALYRQRHRNNNSKLLLTQIFHQYFTHFLFSIASGFVVPVAVGVLYLGRRLHS